MKKLVRPKEYAQQRSVSDRTVRAWLYSGLIPHIKIRRVVLIDPVKADAALEQFERKVGS